MVSARDAPALRFHFDFVSPYAYLAWTRIGALARRHDATLEPVAVLFAGLLRHAGQLGPAEIPAKARWLWRNALRKADRLGVPLRPPPSHPFNPLAALRVCCAVNGRDRRLRVVDRLFRAVWCDGVDVSDTARLRAVLAEIEPDDGAADALLAAAATEAVKQRLADQTRAAIDAGVFGVPTVLVADAGGAEALFWGEDDLDYLDAWLDGRPDVDPERLAAFLALRPSTRRQR